MQKLILPFNKAMMLCGYMNPEYLGHWGYNHNGIDISASEAGVPHDYVIASGDGHVVACGKDPTLGYGVCIVYNDCYNHETGETVDLVARYMHLEEMCVTLGQEVKAGDPIGIEGREGTTDYHLHFELDTDLGYPRYTPQVAKRPGAFWIRGLDTTVNPSYFLHVGVGQELVEPTYNPDWLNKEDFNIPVIANSLEQFIEEFSTLIVKHMDLIQEYANRQK